jgi:DNA-binding transcriptional regulator YiaG
MRFFPSVASTGCGQQGAKEANTRHLVHSAVGSQFHCSKNINPYPPQMAPQPTVAVDPVEIRAWRIERGASIRQLAAVLGVAERSLAAWERSEVRIPRWFPLALIGAEKPLRSLQRREARQRRANARRRARREQQRRERLAREADRLRRRMLHERLRALSARRVRVSGVR